MAIVVGGRFLVCSGSFHDFAPARCRVDERNKLDVMSDEFATYWPHPAITADQSALLGMGFPDFHGFVQGINLDPFDGLEMDAFLHCVSVSSRYHLLEMHAIEDMTSQLEVRLVASLEPLAFVLRLELHYCG